MSLSKPIIDLFTAYVIQLYDHPIRTKAISSGVAAGLGNLLSQTIQKKKSIDYDGVGVYALYGFLFGGAIPHYFWLTLEKLISRKSSAPLLKKLVIERLIFMPLFQTLSLFMIPLFEGRSFDEAINQVKTLLKPMVIDNWKFITLIQVLNIAYVPPMLRVLVGNFIGLLWIIHLANRRAKKAKREDRRSDSIQENLKEL